MAASASRDPGPTSGQVFARLVGELEELGFEPTRPPAHPHDTVHTTVYTATDDRSQDATKGVIEKFSTEYDPSRVKLFTGELARIRSGK